MTPLQLKLMERADKTEDGGCLVLRCEKIYYSCGIIQHLRGGVNKETIIRIYNDFELRCLRSESDIARLRYIGHLYGFERLMYFFETINKEQNKLIDTWIEISKYQDRNKELLLKPCIDRPEEGQKLVLDFLQTLPSNS